jgi:serine/threonine protein kinase
MASDRRTRRIERLLDEAEQAVSNLDWAQAVLAFDPNNGDALDLLNGAERALGVSTPPPPSQLSTSATPSTQSALPIDPSSFANGRYQVKRFLGEGGKKKVYLAQDTTLDREVAFALIKSEGLDDVSRTRIQREAQAMGRLGSHPHIVTVFDLVVSHVWNRRDRGGEVCPWRPGC